MKINVLSVQVIFYVKKKVFFSWRVMWLFWQLGWFCFEVGFLYFIFNRDSSSTIQLGFFNLLCLNIFSECFRLLKQVYTKRK